MVTNMAWRTRGDLCYCNCCTLPGAALRIYRLVQEDLMSLGRLVLQLCCRNLAAASNENLQRSLETVDSQYGAEMKNLVWQLLSAGGLLQPLAVTPACLLL